MLTDMSSDQLGEFILYLMRNKEEAIRQIMEHLGRSEDQYEGLISVLPSLATETSDANLRHQLKTCMQVQAQQSQAIKMLLIISLVNVSSDDFQKNLAYMATKMGKGDEAFREFVKQKFGDKFGGKS